MNLKNYEESKARGLEHLLDRMTPDELDRFDKRNQMLANGAGSRSGCLRTLSSDCGFRSMLADFRDGDIDEMKQWAYRSAKSSIMLTHLEAGRDYLTEELLWPLISDNDDVIDWYRQYQVPYLLPPVRTRGDKDDPKSWLFYRYQSWLALNQRWDELGDRCERILAMQDEITKDRTYLIDHRFYLALAKGDKAAMEAVLMEKVTPAQRRRRYLQQSGITWDLIDSYTMVFAKLAWRSGYQLELDTPWVPRAWLPLRPLSSYDAPWPFMQDFDIWQPFEGEWASWSPKRPGAPQP